MQAEVIPFGNLDLICRSKCQADVLEKDVKEQNCDQSC